MYVTTALPYVNAEPHIGHLYEMVVCDTLARYWRTREPTFFLTGTDEHGDKIARVAAEAGVSPRAFADRLASTFRETWDSCGISYDHLVRTTDPSHGRVVQEVLRRVHAKGDIYLARYGGKYCTACERYYTEKEVIADQCPVHQRPLEYIEEDNYFFRMSKYQAPWLRYLEEHPDAIVPEGYRNEVLALLRSEALTDLSISRPKTRLNWGIDLPFDDAFVTYVWFDALFAYVSGLKAHGEETFERFWPQVHHIIGKDILKPHGVFWPTMLMAADLPLYQQLRVHGFWNQGGRKMSKSLGNVVGALELRDRFGMEAVRYFLLREMAYGHDAMYGDDVMITRMNADLANNLGNLVSRTLSMQQRYFDGAVQPFGAQTEEDRQLAAAFEAAFRDVPRYTGELAFHRALEALWRAIDQTNVYITVSKPFTLAKEPTTRARAGAVLHHALEALHTAATLLGWLLPETSARIFALLRLPAPSTLPETLEWGTHIPLGHVVDQPVALFPRIETAPSTT